MFEAYRNKFGTFRRKTEDAQLFVITRSTGQEVNTWKWKKIKPASSRGDIAKKVQRSVNIAPQFKELHQKIKHNRTYDLPFNLYATTILGRRLINFTNRYICIPSYTNRIIPVSVVNCYAVYGRATLVNHRGRYRIVRCHILIREGGTLPPLKLSRQSWSGHGTKIQTVRKRERALPPKRTREQRKYFGWLNRDGVTRDWKRSTQKRQR